MPGKLRILMVSTEVAPFVRTGGAAAVTGELAQALAAIGHDVRLAMPCYKVIDPAELKPLGEPFAVAIDQKQEQARILEGSLGGKLPVYFVENAPLFERDALYGFPDDPERFIFFCRAALELCKRLDWPPHVVHCQDWQTGIIPNWLKTVYADDPFFENTASLFTIHNLAFRGIYGQRVLQVAGLERYGFIVHPQVAPEVNQAFDLTARGFLFADAISTVSRTYAQEVLTPEFGEKLDPVLRERKARLRGIPNGIDTVVFDPGHDPELAATFTTDTLERRAANKRALQEQAGLAQDASSPLLAVISRLNDTKGLDLLQTTSEKFLDLGAQLIIMGTGETRYQEFLSNLAVRFPRQVAVFLTFQASLEHRILAGADLLLMPSRVEPGGTTQLESLRYGCIPVVHATGGLADSISEYDSAAGTGNGFSFVKSDSWSFFATVVRALEAWRRLPERRALQRNGMAEDVSWAAPAREYVELYEFARAQAASSLDQRRALGRDLERTEQTLAALPERIRRLGDLAYNLWWSWNPDSERLFQEIEPVLWDDVNHNPIYLLRRLDQSRLAALAQDTSFLAHYDRVLHELDRYMRAPSTWFQATYPYAGARRIAYFSAEYGLHESLPIYSGGLGVLAGDHCKEASDLGLPLTAVGFLYPQGYFRQELDAEGRQQAIYEKLNLARVPAFPALDPAGNHVMIRVEMPGREVYAKVWQVQVGRISLYLMDTDIEQNRPEDRELSYRLYGGDREIRISQEIVLGIGGVRVLRALGQQPDAFHMNEGHSAFLGLELLREQVAQGSPFAEAFANVQSHNLFTTHTPVPAGNDVFSFDLIDKYFSAYWPQMGLSREGFLSLGQQNGVFSMTVLALKLSSYHNGVSQIHGGVARSMWNFLWPDKKASDVPISYITNGIHTATWLAPEWSDLFERVLGQDWYEHLDDPKLWDKLGRADDSELWAVHRERKRQLCHQARRRLRARLARLQAPSAELEESEHLFDAEALTIGFARRFATYKRANLIFRDPDRLARFLNRPGQAIQIIFAGKAHPADEGGQALIRDIIAHTREPRFHGKVVFLEDYDMDLASYLVSGVDLWLNTPLRPLEASGTSGEKASANGVINASVSDGWWAEAFNNQNGWQVGDPHRRFQTQEAGDNADAQALYWVLETMVAPLYFDRGPDGLPHGWIGFMKQAIQSITPQFSSRRMVKQYTERYVQAMLGQLPHPGRPS